MTISHTTIKADGQANQYDMKFGGAVLGRAIKGKIEVKVGDKTKTVDGFIFKPTADFTKVGNHEGQTMKDLKDALTKATAAAGIEALKKADPLPTSAGGDEVKAVEPAATVAGDDGDVDL